MTSVWAVLWAILGAVVDFRRWVPKSWREWVAWFLLTALAIGVAVAADLHLWPRVGPLHLFDLAFSGPSSWLYGGRAGLQEA
ncbi:hypothetical protein [Alicyclobacillus acidocaldarius]|uniref:hypothetical protein n=1 Tax=Alicyclobacillus acidocaldarius TaxID=405212 RepID=UPI00345E8D11